MENALLGLEGNLWWQMYAPGTIWQSVDSKVSMGVWVQMTALKTRAMDELQSTGQGEKVRAVERPGWGRVVANIPEADETSISKQDAGAEHIAGVRLDVATWRLSWRTSTEAECNANKCTEARSWMAQLGEK